MLNLIRASAAGGDERSAKMHAYLLERVRFRFAGCWVMMGEPVGWVGFVGASFSRP